MDNTNITAVFMLLEELTIVEVKASVYDKIIMHLSEILKSDHRLRERKRARIALKQINKWFDESHNKITKQL